MAERAIADKPGDSPEIFQTYDGAVVARLSYQDIMVVQDATAFDAIVPTGGTPTSRTVFAKMFSGFLELCVESADVSMGSRQAGLTSAILCGYAAAQIESAPFGYTQSLDVCRRVQVALDIAVRLQDPPLEEPDWQTRTAYRNAYIEALEVNSLKDLFALEAYDQTGQRPM